MSTPITITADVHFSRESSRDKHARLMQARLSAEPGVTSVERSDFDKGVRLTVTVEEVAFWPVRGLIADWTLTVPGKDKLWDTRVTVTGYTSALPYAA